MVCTNTRCLMWPQGSAAAQLSPAGRTSAQSPVVPSEWQWWEGLRDSVACFCGKSSPVNTVGGWALLFWQSCLCSRVMGGKTTLAKQQKFRQSLLQNLGWVFGSFSPQWHPSSTPVSVWNCISSHPGGQQCASESLHCECYLKPLLHLFVFRGFLSALFLSEKN